MKPLKTHQSLVQNIDIENNPCVCPRMWEKTSSRQARKRTRGIHLIIEEILPLKKIVVTTRKYFDNKKILNKFIKIYVQDSKQKYIG